MEVSGRTEDPSESLLYGSEDDVKLYCKPCDTDGPRVPAYGYCQDCEEHLCETCYKSHRKPAPCRNHVLLDKTQMPKFQTLSQHQVPDDLTEKCQQHKGKLIEYVCHDHNSLGCSPCITISHRNCKIDYIPDVSANFTSSPQYQHLQDSIKTLQENLPKVINHAKENERKLLENKTTIKNEIRKLRQEINRMFDQLEAKLHKQTDDLLAVETARIDSLATGSVKMLRDIESLQDGINKLDEASKYNALYIKAKRNEATVKSCTSTLLKMQEQNSVNTYVFEANKVIKDMLHSDIRMGQILPQHGTTSSLPMLDKLGDLSTNQQQELSAGGTLRKGQLYKKLRAIPAGEINVQIKSDKHSCSIPGVVVIDNATIAILDSTNWSLKLVDRKQKEVLSTKTLSSSPGSLKMLQSRQLAVTLPTEKQIVFLSLADSLAEVHRLKVDGKCCDIASMDGKLVVIFEYPGKVQIMDEKGHIFKTMEHDYFGNLFKHPLQLSVDRNNRYIYVSDWNLQTISCFNWEGHVTNGYKDENLVTPCGLVTLEDGSLLVCSSSNNSIHLMSPNLEKGRVILEEKDGLKCPWSVALDREQNMMFVGSGSSFDFVKVFALK